MLATTDDNYEFLLVEAFSERDCVLFAITIRFKEADKRVLVKIKVSKQAVEYPSFGLCDYLLQKVAVAARQLMRRLNVDMCTRQLRRGL